MQRTSCFFRGLWGTFSLLALVALAGPARASESAPRDAVSADEKAGTSAELAADEGLLLPLTHSPRISSGHATVAAMAGYDSSVDDVAARSSLDVRILSMLAVRLDFDHGKGMGPDDRLGVGARLRLLQQSAHGIDGSLGLAYQPNDFRQEGQIVGSILLARSFGRLQLFGNVLFGGDAEGDDQAGETRASLLYRVFRQVHVGFDSRFRINMSEDAKRAGTQATDWQLQATPTASFGVGPIALLGQAGLSMVQTTGPFGTPREKTVVDTGVVAMAGVGGAF